MKDWLTAKEANRLYNEKRNWTIEKELEKLMPEIEKAARNGEDGIYEDYSIDDATVKKLVELGYYVEVVRYGCSDEGYTEIYWNDEALKEDPREKIRYEDDLGYTR